MLSVARTNIFKEQRTSLSVEGDRGAGGVREGGEEGAGSGRKGGEITQHCAIFRNRKNAKRREPTNRGREPGLKGTEAGGLNPPDPLPPIKCLCNGEVSNHSVESYSAILISLVLQNNNCDFLD